jgi:hypothetical protein
LNQGAVFIRFDKFGTDKSAVKVSKGMLQVEKEFLRKGIGRRILPIFDLTGGFV